MQKHIRDTSKVNYPLIDSDIDGRVILLWEESSGANDGVYWQRYLPHAGWSEETLFSSEALGYGMRLKLNDNGEASLFYRESGAQYRTFN